MKAGYWSHSWLIALGMVCGASGTGTLMCYGALLPRRLLVGPAELAVRDGPTICCSQGMGSHVRPSAVEGRGAQRRGVGEESFQARARGSPGALHRVLLKPRGCPLCVVGLLAVQCPQRWLLLVVRRPGPMSGLTRCRRETVGKGRSLEATEPLGGKTGRKLHELGELWSQPGMRLEASVGVQGQGRELVFSNIDPGLSTSTSRLVTCLPAE